MNNTERLNDYESNTLGSGTGNQSEPEWYEEYECGDCNHACFADENGDCGVYLIDITRSTPACKFYLEPGLITPEQFLFFKQLRKEGKC